MDSFGDAMVGHRAVESISLGNYEPKPQRHRKGCASRDTGKFGAAGGIREPPSVDGGGLAGAAAPAPFIRDFTEGSI